MRVLLLVLAVVLGAGVSMSGWPPAASPTAHAADVPVHELWRADRTTGFEDWSFQGARAADGRLALAEVSADAEAGTFAGLERPAGVAGLAVSPVKTTTTTFRELIASWNAQTPAGSWIEVRVRAQVGGPDGRWTRWYDLGSWASDAGPERRQSVKNQRDADGRVSTDTIMLAEAATAYQVALTLRADAPTAADALAADRAPSVSLVAVLASSPSPTARPLESASGALGVTLPVPERSQMVYPNGGPVWCSPTSTSMVMAYWGERLGDPALDRPVPEVAAAVYDVVYRGNGNWPFNTAYASQFGLTAYVSRMSSLAQVERWIEAGIPVVASLAWSPGELGNAAVPSTDGHLLVIVGFTPAGDVVVNDPAADPRLGISVRRVYPRPAMERLWLTHSGGTVYLIYPPSVAPPATDVAFGAW
ncbi:MAG: peptidase C39 family protein [Chloroflexi bacterium]|nr:peptidase C39 family protein [Chloroflexota bacterium]